MLPSFGSATSDPESIEACLSEIAEISKNAAYFWKSAHGWAPREAADLLSQARLDWLDSLSRTLGLRVQEVSEHVDEPSVIIIAWVHLRALVEGNLMLFLTVHLREYKSDFQKMISNRKPRCTCKCHSRL